MARATFCARLAPPLAFLMFAASPALAQSQRTQSERAQPARAQRAEQQRAQQTPATKPDSANPTRKLEAEIEQYPGPNDTVTDSAETVIPEAIEGKPTARARAKPAASNAGAPPLAGSQIDARQVQRVFGQDTAVLELAALDAKQVTRLQQRLGEMGHYLGEIDGVVGPKTRAALQALIAAQFALSRQLLRQGQMTSELALQVGVAQTGIGAHESGAPTSSPPQPLPQPQP